MIASYPFKNLFGKFQPFTCQNHTWIALIHHPYTKTKTAGINLDLTKRRATDRDKVPPVPDRL